MKTYQKHPSIKVEGKIVEGFKKINTLLSNSKGIIVLIDCYTGVHFNELKENFHSIEFETFINTYDLFKSEQEILEMTERFITSDVLFGYISNLSLIDFFDAKKLKSAREKVRNTIGRVIVLGPGAQFVSDKGTLVYADMPRWEIQMRMRRKEVEALGVDNRDVAFSLQYKRGYFNDWKVLDKHKRNIYHKVDFWLDTVSKDNPKLIDKSTFDAGLEKASKSPFRVVPFFDPAPWGGQWMKEKIDLDQSKPNYGWCFDCVPEENSLLLDVKGSIFEMPSVNLVYTKSKELLGEAVEARFGKEFPIRFDFLDTFDGGNLSLQVHPTTQYSYENFGLQYTQDESYYMLDAGKGAHVYLGLKTGVNKEKMLSDLEKSQTEKGFVFDAEKYTNRIPTKKHDHFLIPAGTIHCSGQNAMVLEISATPNFFTFKLWDWNRLGLDGKPRPINIERGKEVIDWSRDTKFVNEQLANVFEVVAKGDGWVEEKTGLHRNEFIETRRHTFSKPVLHNTNGGVNVLNLIDGKEAIIKSPTGAFEPYVVHYAETFIIPACVGEYTISGHGESQGKECMTIKAYVRV